MTWKTIEVDEPPEDIRAEHETLTLAELGRALALVPDASRFSLGYDCPGGFDSMAALRTIVIDEDKIYLRIDTSLPKRHRKISVSWRHRQPDLFVKVPVENQVEVFAQVTAGLDPATPIWLAVQQAFTATGPHFFVPIKVAGPSCFVGGRGQYFLEPNVLSIYGTMP